MANLGGGFHQSEPGLWSAFSGYTESLILKIRLPEYFIEIKAWNSDKNLIIPKSYAICSSAPSVTTADCMTGIISFSQCRALFHWCVEFMSKNDFHFLCSTPEKGPHGSRRVGLTSLTFKIHKKGESQITELVVFDKGWLVYSRTASLNYIKQNRLKDRFCLKPCFSMEILSTYQYDLLLARIGPGEGPHVFTCLINAFVLELWS